MAKIGALGAILFYVTFVSVVASAAPEKTVVETTSQDNDGGRT